MGVFADHAKSLCQEFEVPTRQEFVISGSKDLPDGALSLRSSEADEYFDKLPQIIKQDTIMKMSM